MPLEEMRTNGGRLRGFEELVRYMAHMGLFSQNIPVLIRPFEGGDPRPRDR